MVAVASLVLVACGGGGGSTGGGGDEEGSTGQFLAGDPSFVTNDEALIENLDLNFKVVYAGSEAALITAFRQAEENQEYLIGYFYEPQWFLSEVPLVKVDLPAYEEGCDADPATVACDYPEYILDKIASSEFMDSGSPAAALVENFEWTNDDQNIVAKYIAEDGMKQEEAAQKWIADNPDKVSAWVDGIDSGTDCGEFNMAINPWVGYEASAYVVGEVAVQELGCDTQYKTLKEEIAWQGFGTGEVDVVIENWGHDDLKKKYVEGQKTAVVVGPNGNIGVIGWYVPPWLAEAEPDVLDWENLNDYADDFATSESS
jgi:ABC-type proline/glycine betaine transport system substrate-binding protein